MNLPENSNVKDIMELVHLDSFLVHHFDNATDIWLKLHIQNAIKLL